MENLKKYKEKYPDFFDSIEDKDIEKAKKLMSKLPKKVKKNKLLMVIATSEAFGETPVNLKGISNNCFNFLVELIGKKEAIAAAKGTELAFRDEAEAHSFKDKENDEYF